MKHELTLHGLNILLEMVDEVLTDVQGKSYEDFSNDNQLVRATCFSLIQIGESLSTISKKLGEIYPEVPWEYAKDMPNFILHDFNHIHTQAVYNTAIHDMPKLKDLLTQIKEDLQRQS